jgi:iron complex outermembrane receptor protein
VNAQTTSDLPTCDVTAPVNIRPDSLWSFELGAKNSLLDGKLAVDTSVYIIDWKDIQNFTDVPQCGIGAIFNLGRAISKGFDLSMQGLLSHDFKMGLALGYTDTYFKDTVIAPGIGQIVAAGERIAGASDITGAAIPPWSVALSGQYDFAAFGHPAYVSFQDLFHSRNNGPFATKNPANALQYDPSLPTDPATNVLNVRLGLRFQHVNVMFFVNNALDTHPQLSVNHAVVNDPRLAAVTFRPRTVGVSASLRY